MQQRRHKRKCILKVLHLFYPPNPIGMACQSLLVAWPDSDAQRNKFCRPGLGGEREVVKVRS